MIAYKGALTLDKLEDMPIDKIERYAEKANKIYENMRN